MTNAKSNIAVKKIVSCVVTLTFSLTFAFSLFTRCNSLLLRKWNQYRIGDGVDMYPGAPSCETFPGSIVCDYQRETDQPKNISTLIRVLDRRSKKIAEDNVAFVHVRLGDGLCAKNDEPCRGIKSSDPDCWNDHRDCWDDGIKYAYSKDWYEPVVSQLRKMHVKQIIVVGDKFHWTRTPDPRHGDFSVDEAYLDRMARFFQSNGFKVVLQQPDFPDSDFILLCSARVFVRGGGGYSALVAHVVKNRGGVVIQPSLT